MFKSIHRRQKTSKYWIQIQNNKQTQWKSLFFLFYSIIYTSPSLFLLQIFAMLFMSYYVQIFLSISPFSFNIQINIQLQYEYKNILSFMESESNKKRNIFRSSLRREFIQSFQQSIRNKYLQMEKQQRSNQSKLQFKQATETVIANLQEILSNSSQEICNNSNFQYFIQCIQLINSKKNGFYHEQSAQNSWQFDNYFHAKQSQLYNSQYTAANSNQYSSRLSNEAQFRQCRSMKVNSTWKYKEKIYSLLYRLIDKSLNEQKGRVWYVIDNLLYLLQFPELMPLWQKLSQTKDLKSKNYIAGQFIKKFSKSVNNTLELSSILDSDFVLDVLSNLIVESPFIEFEKILQLIPCIGYGLGIVQKSKSIHEKDHEQIKYPKINKVCIILRSILKQDCSIRLARLIENSYDYIILFLIEEMCRLFGHNRMKQKQEVFQMQEQMNEYSQKFSPLKTRLQCDYFEKYSKVLHLNQFKISKKPPTLQLTAKINLIKLVNRLFVANSNIASFLYLKSTPKTIFHSLISIFSDPHYICNIKDLIIDNPDMHEKTIILTQNSKYGIILCNSHRMLLKNILSTLHTIIITTSKSEHSFLGDFLESGGIKFLMSCSKIQEEIGDYSKQILNLISAIESQPNYFYSRLDSNSFIKFIKIEISLICTWIQKYLTCILDSNSFSSSSVSKFIDIRYCLNKILKITRNSLLQAYARATEPKVFIESTQIILYSSDCLQLLDKLNDIDQQGGIQQQQIRMYARNIKQVCENPKEYLQKHGNGSINLNFNHQ